MKLELLAQDIAARRAELKKRNRAFNEETVPAGMVETYLQDGWHHVRTNKSGTQRLRKRKPIDQILEDEFWSILYKLGYPTLNIGRNFKIPRTANPTGPKKQIDVFAYDDSSIIVVECKSQVTRNKKRMGAIIDEFSGLRKPLSDSIRRHFGGEMNQKIIWVIATKNIVWDPKDIELAKQQNIEVITDTELRYYSEIASRIGEAAKYQFQAEFTKTSKALREVKVFALQSRLAGETVYSFFAPASKVLPISFVNHRDLRDPESSPSYQRMVQKNRLKQIGAFLKDGGYFPNSIVVNIREQFQFDQFKPADDDGITPGMLTLPKKFKSLMIIDGQHRLYGYTQLPEGEGPLLQFLAFADISVTQETRMFSDINFQQKTVSRKLLDEIAGEINLDSTDPNEQMRAISARTFDLMRHDLSGPLHEKIAGSDIRGGASEPLTVPELNNAVISSHLLGSVRKIKGEKEALPGLLTWTSAEQGIERLQRLLSAYLGAFQSAAPERWEAGKDGVFCRNAGVGGLILLLADAIHHHQRITGENPHLKEPEELAADAVEVIRPLIDRFRGAPLEELSAEFKTRFGGSGPRDFRRKARFVVHASNSEFKPEGLEKELREYGRARTEVGDKLTRVIQESVISEIVKGLKSVHGTDAQYLIKAGMPPTKFGQLSQRQAEHYAEFDKLLPLETFVDFIEWRQICKKSNNWDAVKDAVSFNLENKGNPARDDLLSWFNIMNQIRRVPAHPYGRENYTDEQFELLVRLYRAFHERGLIDLEINLDAVS